jgi:hypothetical protein
MVTLQELRTERAKKKEKSHLRITSMDRILAIIKSSDRSLVELFQSEKDYNVRRLSDSDKPGLVIEPFLLVDEEKFSLAEELQEKSNPYYEFSNDVFELGVSHQLYKLNSEIPSEVLEKNNLVSLVYYELSKIELKKLRSTKRKLTKQIKEKQVDDRLLLSDFCRFIGVNYVSDEEKFQTSIKEKLKLDYLRKYYFSKEECPANQGFKVGDEIIMNSAANKEYKYTKEGSKGKIIGFDSVRRAIVKFSYLTNSSSQNTYDVGTNYMKLQTPRRNSIASRGESMDDVVREIIGIVERTDYGFAKEFGFSNTEWKTSKHFGTLEGKIKTKLSKKGEEVFSEYKIVDLNSSYNLPINVYNSMMKGNLEQIRAAYFSEFVKEEQKEMNKVVEEIKTANSYIQLIEAK